MHDLSLWFIAAATIFLGCWLQTALGFGMALVAAPVLVIFHPEWVPVVLTITALLLSLINAYNQRHAIALGEITVAMLTRIPGTLAGTGLLLLMDERLLQLTVAVSVLAAVAVSLVGQRFEATPWRLGVAGFISGVMGSTSAIGGPAMALVMQHGHAATVRANLSLYFCYSSALSLLAFAAVGLIDTSLLLASASLIPVALLGFWVGLAGRGYVDAGRFRPLLLLVCALAGGVALANACFG